MKVQMYRWSVQASNPYAFSFKIMQSGTISSDKGEYSGFVRKDKVKELLATIKAAGVPYSHFRMITSERYWKNWDFYLFNPLFKNPKTRSGVIIDHIVG